MKIINLFINLLFCKNIIAFPTQKWTFEKLEFEQSFVISSLNNYNIKNINKQNRLSNTLIKAQQFEVDNQKVNKINDKPSLHSSNKTFSFIGPVVPDSKASLLKQDLTGVSAKNFDFSNLHFCTEIIKLTRLKQNIIPVTILSLIGGFIANTSWKEWVLSPSFLAAYTMMMIMTGVSMIINDIYDIDIDKINNPNRPLVTGTVTLSEARYLSIILFSIYSYLGIKYLPPILNPVWIINILLSVIYTPILKKIFFIKNLTCANIVSSSVPFIGLSIINYDTTLMFITTKITFVASLYIEILLDICDREGDKKMNIQTIPVLFGNNNALNILSILLFCGNINIICDIIKLNNPILCLGTILTFLPFYSNLINIKKNNYTKISIHKALGKINISLLIFLLTIVIKNIS